MKSIFMRPFLPAALLLLILCSSISVYAQFQGLVYQPDTVVKVYDEKGNERPLAWCGGFDHPQFSIADLNHDGMPDLVVYEHNVGLRTFLNIASPGNPAIYKYAPQYEVNFPPINNYLIMRDYNRDSVMDLFQYGYYYDANGFDAWRGYYDADNNLKFKHYKSLFYNNTSPAPTYYPVNAYTNSTDIPAIEDVDGDGDLDFLGFYILGAFVYEYKNEQVEKGLSKDSIYICDRNECWGDFTQLYYLAHNLNVTCSSPPPCCATCRLTDPTSTAKKTHTGNAFCLVDMEGNGDWDYLDGNVSWNQLVYLKNGKYLYGKDSMIAQDTTWPSYGHVLNLPVYPMPNNIDIDGDGKKDVVVTVNGTSGENYKCIVLYKNTGTVSKPVFTYESDSFLIDQTIDVGSAAYPMFFDYDKDGKPDLFIGSDGYYQSDGTLKARLSYYRNTSTPGHPSFTLQTRDFLTLSTYGFAGAAPAVGDIDNDGKTDLIIGHTNGTISYFKNIAASDSVQPIWRIAQLKLTDYKGDTINVGGNAAPFVYDIDKNGKPDLLIGNFHGTLEYYENIATSSGTPYLSLANTKLGKVKADKNNYAGYSVPFIGKMDNSGKDYLLLGSKSGMLGRYDGFQSGDTAGAYTMIDSMYSFIDSSYLIINNYYTLDSTGLATWKIYTGVYDNFRSAPAVADIDGDGKYEMVVGDTYGGVKLYEQIKNVPITGISTTPAEKDNIIVYPNPASNTLFIAWGKDLRQNLINISISNVKGEQVVISKVAGTAGSSQIDISNLVAGNYTITLQSNNFMKSVKFTVIK